MIPGQCALPNTAELLQKECNLLNSAMTAIGQPNQMKELCGSIELIKTGESTIFKELTDAKRGIPKVLNDYCEKTSVDDAASKVESTSFSGRLIALLDDFATELGNKVTGDVKECLEKTLNEL